MKFGNQPVRKDYWNDEPAYKPYVHWIIFAPQSCSSIVHVPGTGEMDCCDCPTRTRLYNCTVWVVANTPVLLQVDKQVRVVLCPNSTYSQTSFAQWDGVWRHELKNGRQVFASFVCHTILCSFNNSIYKLLQNHLPVFPMAICYVKRSFLLFT